MAETLSESSTNYFHSKNNQFNVVRLKRDMETLSEPKRFVVFLEILVLRMVRL